MLTAILYVVLIALVAGLLFVVAALVFGRGEEMAPLPPGVSPAWLPDHAIDGDDVRALRFQQAFRGYKASEVDWALQRLANEVERLRAVVAAQDGALGVHAGDVEGPGAGGGHADTSAVGEVPADPDGGPGRCGAADDGREE
ncbi:DivIVA domain-containing protein [Tomitella fengzijianii]|uniref:DivIVA domain-containing protein n=1 Tax=Tomitella fengzijianii TaxID=2597660 RepID=A0A516X2F7_9ACTN|nr:DivIVA domain-containing protein [Tomitella fengzijianii]QDQ97235.1 DivIVA domain-containing protein [Tomitella fengzijianii]